MEPLTKGSGEKPSFVKTFKTIPTGVKVTTERPVITQENQLSIDKSALRARQIKETRKATVAVSAAAVTAEGPRILPEPQIQEVSTTVSTVPTPPIAATGPTLIQSLFGIGSSAVKSQDPVSSGTGTLNQANFSELEDAVIKYVSQDPVEAKPQDGVYMPQDRRAIGSFIIQTYKAYLLRPQVTKVLDACASMKSTDVSELKAMQYQAFVRDYMARDSPYRGLLVYHGLGSGKTCTSIAAEEALYWGGMRKVFIMTPASLEENYREELMKCGYYALNPNNHWRFVTLPSMSVDTQEYNFLQKIYGLSKASIMRRGGGWVAVPDPKKIKGTSASVSSSAWDKSVHFDKLSVTQQADIRKQIREHMNERFKFVHYIGLRETTVKQWICSDTNLFDNAVVIIDEVHNLVRAVQGSKLDYFYKKEPHVPNYAGSNEFCKEGKKYKVTYGLYRLLMNAVGCKIIALSGTPIINQPNEIGILANLLAGEKRIIRVNIQLIQTSQEVEKFLNMHPEVDYVNITVGRAPSGQTTQELVFTPVPSGMRKVIDAAGIFRGFVRQTDIVTEEELNRERKLDEFFGRIADILKENKYAILGDQPSYNALPILPDEEEDFVNKFIDRNTLSIKKTFILQSRLSGLISYYRGSKKELVASVIRDEIVELPMSDFQLSQYTTIRNEEIEKEEKKSKTKTAAPTSMIAGLTLFERDFYEQATKKISTTFKIFSRAACNFVFPKDIIRPKPANVKEAAQLLGVRTESTLIEGQEATDEDDAEDDLAEMEIDTEMAVPGTGEDVMTTAGDATSQEQIDEGLTDETRAERAAAINAVGAADRKSKQVQDMYAETIKLALQKMRENANTIYDINNLKTYSPKYAAILEKIKESPGPALVYSQFKTLEGLGILAEVLKYNGYIEIKINLVDKEWRLSDELGLNENKGKQRFIRYTGDASREEQKILLNIFNWQREKLPNSIKKDIRNLANGNRDNLQGGIVRIMMITQSGAEGISLMNTRQVHVMEPYWNMVRTEQVKGRAIRICSHKDLPLSERTVEVFTYVMKFSNKQVADGSVDQTLQIRDKKLTTDQQIQTIAQTKYRLSSALFGIMQTSAVDCSLTALEHGTKACFRIDSGGTNRLYDPDIKVDYVMAESKFKEVTTATTQMQPQIQPQQQPASKLRYTTVATSDQVARTQAPTLTLLPTSDQVATTLAPTLDILPTLDQRAMTQAPTSALLPTSAQVAATQEHLDQAAINQLQQRRNESDKEYINRLQQIAKDAANRNETEVGIIPNNLPGLDRDTP